MVNNAALNGKTVPVLIAYRKEINTRKHAIAAKKEVKGNVIIYVSERLIDRFNMIPYTGNLMILKHIPEHERRLLGGKKIKCNGYEFVRNGLDKTVRRVKLFKGNDYYLINFPYFFNIAMIRDGLFLLLRKNKEQVKFQVLPSQKKRDIFIGNKETVNVWIPKNGKLIQSLNTEHTNFGEVTIVGKPVMRKQSRVAA